MSRTCQPSALLTVRPSAMGRSGIQQWTAMLGVSRDEGFQRKNRVREKENTEDVRCSVSVRFSL